MDTVIDCLERRELIDNMTSPALRQRVEKPIRVYIGFDPTADSLHLGNLLSLIVLAWFQRYGHTPVALVGGATGLVGDPSGKSHERPFLDEQTLAQNEAGIRSDIERVLRFDQGNNKALILNNAEWFRSMGALAFLRDVGKHFRVGPMLAKESVRARLQSEEGMSYTEFSYQVLQGYDFYHLFQNHDVCLQAGGSDQWGNITAGTELIRKLSGKTAYGMTTPLLTRSDGKKFGKSEQGAIWLSPEKLSPYEFYQHLYRTLDADVIRLLRSLTFLDLEEIAHYEERLQSPSASPNEAQKRLAEEVTRLVHGEEGLQTALKVTEGVRPGSETTLDAHAFENLARDMPSCTLSPEHLIQKKIIEVLVHVELVQSKGEARRLIRNGGVYLNNEAISNENQELSPNDLIEGQFLLFAIGKKKKLIVRTA